MKQSAGCPKVCFMRPVLVKNRFEVDNVVSFPARVKDSVDGVINTGKNIFGAVEGAGHLRKKTIDKERMAGVCIDRKDRVG